MKRTLVICIVVAALMLLASQLFALGYPGTGYSSGSTHQNRPTYNSVRTLDHHPHQFAADGPALTEESSPDDDMAAVPEPTTLILMGLGLAALGIGYKLRS